MQGIQIDAATLNEIRERLAKMSEKRLVECGQACRPMCSPEANHRKVSAETYVVQLKEARAEWRRRHPR